MKMYTELFYAYNVLFIHQMDGRMNDGGFPHDRNNMEYKYDANLSNRIL